MKTITLPVFILAVFWLSSCAAVYVTEYSKAPGFDINSKRASSTTVTGFEPVFIREFVKTFGKRYPNTKDFSTEYANKFKDKLVRDKMFATVVYDSAVEWKSTRSGSFSKSDLTAIEALFNSCQTEYVITISDFEVASRVQTTHTGGYGPNSMGSSSSTEYCIIDARFVIYDVKTRKKLQEF